MDKSFRLARDLRLFHDLAPPIHNANAREFQRHVDSGIMFHGCPPSLDAWGRLNVVTPFHHLSGDSHLHPLLGARPITASSAKSRVVRSPVANGGKADKICFRCDFLSLTRIGPERATFAAMHGHYMLSLNRC